MANKEKIFYKIYNTLILLFDKIKIEMCRYKPPQNNETETLSYYEEYLNWLKTEFFNKVRQEGTSEKPVLITGFITDSDGVIAINNKVPPEIANDPDWQAVMTLWSSADVFVTGMRYLKRVVDSNKPFQNILFPYDKPETLEFFQELEKTGVKFFPDLGDLRQQNNMPTSPDIFIATTDLTKYSELIQNENFKQIINALKQSGRKVVVVKQGNISEEERKLAEEAGLEIISYQPSEEVSKGRAFINAILDYGKNNNRAYRVIANTTGPSVKQLFEEAAKTGLPFYLEVVVVNKLLEAPEEQKTRFCSGDPIKYLEEQGYQRILTTPNLPAKNIAGEEIEQSFNIFKWGRNK